MKVELGSLKDKGEDIAAFLEPRVGTKPTVEADSIEIEDEAVRSGVKPRHVKTYIKRYLFMNGERKKYRVFVTGKELAIQEIILGEKEEEEKKEKEKAAKKEQQEKPKLPAPEPEETPKDEGQAEASAKEGQATPAKAAKAEKPKTSKKKAQAKKKKQAEEKDEKKEEADEPEA